jgi:hypothetical protein
MEIPVNLTTLSLSFRAGEACPTKTTQGRGPRLSQLIRVEASPLRPAISNSKFLMQHSFRGGAACPARATERSLLQVPASNRKPELLDSDLTYRKQKTNEFLIDNFQTFFASSKLPVSSISPRALPASSLQPPTSRHSNRQCSELESPLSHRKQRVEDFLIANFGAVFISLRSPCQPASDFRGDHMSYVNAISSRRLERGL